MSIFILINRPLPQSRRRKSAGVRLETLLYIPANAFCQALLIFTAPYQTVHDPAHKDTRTLDIFTTYALRAFLTILTLYRFEMIRHRKFSLFYAISMVRRERTFATEFLILLGYGDVNLFGTGLLWEEVMEPLADTMIMSKKLFRTWRLRCG